VQFFWVIFARTNSSFLVSPVSNVSLIMKQHVQSFQPIQIVSENFGIASQMSEFAGLIIIYYCYVFNFIVEMLVLNQTQLHCMSAPRTECLVLFPLVLFPVCLLFWLRKRRDNLLGFRCALSSTSGLPGVCILET
jgi:hypothetical protein